MQIYELKTGNGIELGKELKAQPYKTYKCNGDAVNEHHLENLIVENEHLLNFGDENDEILIIAEQPRTELKNRPDLLAIDKNGYLITIEIKRGKNSGRNEPCEFQAIRYAAAHGTMTIDQIVANYAKFLKTKSESENTEEDWKQLAYDKICAHLDQYEEGHDLKEYIRPGKPDNKQKIFLVSGEFEPECLSACAWLRDNYELDIQCIKLCPYDNKKKTDDNAPIEQALLIKERIIPSPDIKDYLETMQEIKEEKEDAERQRTTGGIQIKSVTIINKTKNNEKQNPIIIKTKPNKPTIGNGRDVLVKTIEYAIKNQIQKNFIAEVLSPYPTADNKESVEKWPSTYRQAAKEIGNENGDTIFYVSAQGGYSDHLNISTKYLKN